MARNQYDPEQSIHSMTTRQLRQYIYEKSREAEERIKTSDMKNASRAFKDAASSISNRNGKVIKSTSYMTKAEMMEHAYNLRIFESLDTTSGYAKSIDWKENRERYRTFVKNQLQDPLTADYWSKYLTKKGKEALANKQLITGQMVSKRGYEKYKEYVSFIRNISTMIDAYGYETIKEYAQKASDDPKRGKVIEKLLADVYFNSMGKGLTQAQLNDAFQIALRKYDEANRPAHFETVKQPKPGHNTITAKTGRKMRTSGAVHRKLT